MDTVSLGVLGLIGAVLAITGIFGMAAYSVSKRLKELGIRLALGAQPKEVLQAALGRAFKLACLPGVKALLAAFQQTTPHAVDVRNAYAATYLGLAISLFILYS
jgi:ABC-type antimicrobial peptide transport system permease subunit